MATSTNYIRPIKRTGKLNKLTFFSIVGFTLLIIYSISFVTPLFWALNNSLKSRSGWQESIFAFVNFNTFRIENYFDAFKIMAVPVTIDGIRYDIGFGEMMFNSVIYSSLCTLTHTMIPCITAYCVSKYNFKFSKILYTVVIVTLILPTVGNLASSIQVSKWFNTYDSFLGLSVMKGYFIGTNFLIFYACFKGLSNEYIEAAEMDGASQWQVMTKVMFPLAAPTIYAVALITFITYWNDYTTPMIYLPSHPTIAYGLYYFCNSTTQTANSITVRLAACMIVSIPILVVFILFRKKLMGNMTVGGLKG